ncbi:Uncharacterized protein Rs2_21389 [Raphanus sativus]|nr:Uncharacterized protein Rs2_21389 [Raphanus sativus]
MHKNLFTRNSFPTVRGGIGIPQELYYNQNQVPVTRLQPRSKHTGEIELLLPPKYTTGNRILLWRRHRTHSDSVPDRSPQVELVLSDYLFVKLYLISLESVTCGRYNDFIICIRRSDVV